MENTKQKTCGEYYRETMAEFATYCAPISREEFLTAFAAGVIYGQAEKVFLGACPAAMFRPRQENFAATLDIVHRIASERFGLQTRFIEYAVPGKGEAGFPISSGQNISDESQAAIAAQAHWPRIREIWIFKAREGYHFGLWIHLPVNSPVWHLRRAADCGIRAADSDPWFHERAGYAEVCDEVINKGV